MKISAKGEYALRAVLQLALDHHRQEVTSMQEIAQSQEIPLKFLEQILLTLKKAGLVGSKRGNAGGYYLAKGPDQITVGEVLRITDGPVMTLACISSPMGCERQTRCFFHPLWQEVNSTVEGIIFSTTFADLCGRPRGYMYYI
ncbi:MAG: Rrf2 family transcriptional regulator [Desulfitobacterium hafniense]|nr:Rrf2 family transcriptional regulator [Desulfitobacterium hafniense]